MLLLRRSIGKKIIIGKGIEITVMRIYKNQVRLGISADKNIKIYRQEIQGKYAKTHNYRKNTDDE